MQTHVDGAIVVPADSLVRARPVIGLLVHFDGDRIAGYAFPTSSNSDMQSYKAMTIQNLRMTWQMPLLGVALALQAMSCHKHASASVYWNNMNGIHTLVDTLVTGELLSGRRTQDEPWSTPLIHISWNVAWAATDATSAAAATSFANILAGAGKSFRKVSR